MEHFQAYYTGDTQSLEQYEATQSTPSDVQSFLQRLPRTTTHQNSKQFDLSERREKMNLFIQQQQDKQRVNIKLRQLKEVDVNRIYEENS